MNKNIVKLLALAAVTVVTVALFAPPQPPPPGTMGPMPRGPHHRPHRTPHFRRPDGMVKRAMEFYQEKINQLPDENQKATAQILLNEIRIKQIEINEKEIKLREILSLPFVPQGPMQPGMKPRKGGPRRGVAHHRRQGPGKGDWYRLSEGERPS